MTKKQAQELKPFDVVVSDLGYGENKDLLVKSVTDSGVFCLEKIQSTASLYKFNQIKNQYEV